MNDTGNWYAAERSGVCEYLERLDLIGSVDDLNLPLLYTDMKMIEKPDWIQYTQT